MIEFECLVLNRGLDKILLFNVGLVIKWYLDIMFLDNEKNKNSNWWW